MTPADLADTDVAQPLLFAIQAAMLPVLAEHGLRPAMVLGHSVGEVAAAYAAGLLGLDDAARLIVARSRHQQARRGHGRMAALNAPLEEAEALVAGTKVEIAAVNAPGAVTLAGPEEALAAVCAAAEARRFAVVPLDLDYAFHSAAMDPVRDALLRDLDGLRCGAAALPMLSSVTGEALSTADAGYWWRNLREPVRFEAATRAAIAQGARIFLEIGPHPVLQSYLRETARAAGVEAANIGTLARRASGATTKRDAGDPFPAIVDRAFVAGADPRGARIFAGPASRRIPLTPFDRRRFVHPATVEGARLTDPVEEHPLLGFRRGTEPGIWTRLLDTDLAPWLADHRLGEEAVLPAAAMLDMALAAGRARHPDAAALEVAEFRILGTLPLGQTREIRCTLADGAFRLESRARFAEAWTLHALGEVRPATIPAAIAAPGEGARLDG
ncbi:acyltransferase domain-containing protein, partial [Falsiroseomonas oryziterrae]|uniref:acyltransferase domain-containing protein n=1 Tax=Falsiroseomonas oryziterrae TaxID=2911368 RepID=UPI001F1D757E